MSDATDVGVAPQRRAAACLLLATGLWAGTFFTMQLGDRAIASVAGTSPRALVPLVFLLLRFTAAAAVFALIFPRVLGRLNLSAWWRSFVLSVPFFAGFVLQLWGLQSSTPTVVAFLTNTTVVLTPVFGFLFFRERFAGSILAGGAIAFVGVFVLANPQSGRLQAGELCALLCSIAFALQIQLTNVLTRRGDPEGITLGMFVWVILFSAGGLAMLEQGRPMLNPALLGKILAAPEAAWTIAYNALLASVVAIWLMNRFQRSLAATRAAIIYTLEPVFAAALSAAFIHEPMTPRKILGGAIIVAGNVVCEALRRRGAAPGSGTVRQRPSAASRQQEGR